MSTGVSIEPRAVGTGGRWFRFLRYGLLGCAALLMVVGLVLGARSSTVGRLEGDVATGEVHSVRVIGEEPGDDALVRVQWRPGPLRYQTEVRVARLRSVLRLQPGLTVTRAPWPSSDATVWGWSLPGWMGVAVAALVFTSIGLLIGGPQPWRATRWAWFWLITTPLGVLPFLLLSGRTPLLPDARPAGRRLTGGWAFLLSLVLGSSLR